MQPFGFRLGCLTVAVALTAFPSSANAQKAESKEQPLSETLHGPAKEAYVTARLLFNNGDFAGALTKYAAAYDSAKDARLLYNMALCEKNLRHYARMQSLLLRYRQDPEAARNPDHAASIDEALAAIRNLVGTVRVTANLPGAAVSVDDERVGTTPLADPLALDLGKHRVVVEKSGFVTSTNDVTISGDDQRTVEVTLTPVQHLGHLVVAAEPNSTISLDGTVVATERLDESLTAGAHEVRVTAPGRLPFHSEIDLRDGEARTIEVTLTREEHGAPVWPWIVGGVAVAAGAAVGGYFLFKPADRTNPVPAAPGANITFASWSIR